MSGSRPSLGREVGWVLGVFPHEPKLDRNRDALFSEAVLILNALIVLSYWPVVAMVGFAIGIAGPASARDGLVYVVEMHTAAVMWLFRRPYPRPRLGRPLSREFEYRHGWHLTAVRDQQDPDHDGPQWPDPKPASRAARRVTTFGVEFLVLGIVLMLTLLPVAAAVGAVLGVLGSGLLGVGGSMWFMRQ